ncbi:MAG: ribosome rescue GTPase HflX [Gammaproteobacteria bacterium]
MFERPSTGNRAVLVHIQFRADCDQESLDEFRELVVSANVEPVVIVTGSRNSPDPRYFIGKGKTDEVVEQVLDHKADVVLFNHALSPTQERNLEQRLKCRVVDRTGLILDIFAQRAHTFEGKLQVELAQLKHLSTRLVRGWTHLERQKGGIGLRGPGETQLETDRRLIGARIKNLNRRLDKVRTQRDLRRKSRKKSSIKTISLVGYTNAGKSTLFNQLTEAGVYAADQLFATLDPTLRRVELPLIGTIILADTVGFIRHLPHNLVAAFRATLEETAQAHMLLHVIDAHSENRQECIAQVNEVLKEMGAEDVSQLEIYNKIDLMDDRTARIDRNESGIPVRVWVSAKNGEGIALLKDVLIERLHEGAEDEARFPDHALHASQLHRVRIQPGNARLRSKLYEWGVVVNELSEQGEWILDLMITPEIVSYLNLQTGCQVESESKPDCAQLA